MTIIKDLIPIGRAPEKIPIAEKTLHNWRCQGVYPEFFVKLSRKVFIDLGEFKRFI